MAIGREGIGGGAGGLWERERAKHPRSTIFPPTCSEKTNRKVPTAFGRVKKW